MKKVIIGILALMILFSFSVVLADNDSNNSEDDSDDFDIGENETDDDDDDSRNRTREEIRIRIRDDEIRIRTREKDGLGQEIRRRVKAGVYTNEFGEEIRVRELAQNRFEFRFKNHSAETELEIEEETENNRTKFKVKLRGGRNATIKIMPDVASIIALERLRIKRCNDTNINCFIELKEVGEGNNTRLVYEVRARKVFRIFGFIKNRQDISVEIDAETGEEVRSRRPWWSFLASEEDEAEEIQVA